MNARLSHFVLILIGLTALGCSSSRSVSSGESDFTDRTHDRTAPSSAVNTDTDQAELVLAMSGWLDTPYRYGGTLKSGIDCSAYVQQMMLKTFDVSLPRTTRDQMAAGKEVLKDRLQPGDLVFFQTGRNQYHVGIYLSGGEFTHASTTAGVTVSHLEDYYWKDRFLEARRVLDRPFMDQIESIAGKDDSRKLAERKSGEQRTDPKPKQRTESKPRHNKPSGTRSTGGTWTAPGKTSTSPRPQKVGW